MLTKAKIEGGNEAGLLQDTVRIKMRNFKIVKEDERATIADEEREKEDRLAADTRMQSFIQFSQSQQDTEEGEIEWVDNNVWSY